MKCPQRFGPQASERWCSFSRWGLAEGSELGGARRVQHVLHNCREPGSSEPQTPVEAVCICSPGAPTVRCKTETAESPEFPGLAKLELTTETNKKREPVSKTTEGMV